VLFKHFETVDYSLYRPHDCGPHPAAMALVLCITIMITYVE